MLCKLAYPRLALHKRWLELGVSDAIVAVCGTRIGSRKQGSFRKALDGDWETEENLRWLRLMDGLQYEICVRRADPVHGRNLKPRVDVWDDLENRLSLANV